MGLGTLDIAIVLAYLAGIFILAQWVSREKAGHQKDAQDYFLAGRSLPWWAIGASLIAANISAEQIIGMSGSGYAIGLAIASYEWMAAATLLIVGKWFLPVFLRNGIYTMPQFLEQRYGSRIRTLMAVFWLGLYVFVNVTSILWLGAIAVSQVTGMDQMLAVVLIGVFALLYQLYGGVKAVALTDIVQVTLLVLGGLQGAIGWWMVKSGIVNDVKVSHFRLATHLMVALVTMAAIMWTALDLRALARGEPRARLTGWGALALGVLGLQLVLGALVAGLRAGYVAGSGWFNWDAWPLMQGRLLPDGIDWALGGLHALLNDPYLVHFAHRWWAWVVVAVLVVLARLIRRQHRAASIAIHSAFGTQILLGVATVWSGMELWLAVGHQLTGALTLAATTWGVHALGRARA